MFIMLSCSQRALILILEYVGNFGVRLPIGDDVQYILFIGSYEQIRGALCQMRPWSIEQDIIDGAQH